MLLHCLSKAIVQKWLLQNAEYFTLCKACSIAALLFSVGSLPWLPSEGDCNCDITRVLRLNYFSGLIFDRIVHGSYWLAKLISQAISPLILFKSHFLKSGILSCPFATFCRLLPQIMSGPISNSTSILVYHVVEF